MILVGKGQLDHRNRAESNTIHAVVFPSPTQQSDIQFSRRKRVNAYLFIPLKSGKLAQLIEQIIPACHSRPDRPRHVLDGIRLRVDPRPFDCRESRPRLGAARRREGALSFAQLYA